ncbi:hypothetical protein OSB04_030632 [Centaurea solstitialis]|uniref:Reverse transcriptase Ty1/copia-type domain-containing protein n=1 Tax=Centaurea solstitialis TaxID=347529 RepID=A0AA38S7D1_9ASTR|nr:hypothetical protein OSB04_030632 [Centaurea solstitialis]
MAEFPSSEPQLTSPPSQPGYRGRGRGQPDQRRGCGRGKGRSRGSKYRQQQPTWSHWPSIGQYSAPLCPYPTAPVPSPYPRPQAGILGPAPSPQPASFQQPHALLAPQSPYPYGMLLTPTDLGNAFNTMSLQQPDDAWYMDTGATSHLTNNRGIFPKLFNLSTPQVVLASNGTRMPIHGYGNTTTPPPHRLFTLKNVLYTPHIIKNLISIRQFTNDNHVSVEFDPFGFSVKDLNTGHLLRDAIVRALSTRSLLPPLLQNHLSLLLRYLLLHGITDLAIPDHPDNGDLERYKARLVVNGKSQEVRVDCDETFSPVVKPATIRTVLSIALGRNWPIHQLDVKNVFLHGNLKETVFMHQPPRFYNPSAPGYVCRLRKSLYGLKQAPRAWYQRFANYILQVGFQCSKSDNSLFVYRRGNDIAYLLLYVDDIILTASSERLKVDIISTLHKEFAMTDLGKLSFFLGVSVTRTPHHMFLSQKKYAEDIFHRANMTNCKSMPTPVDSQSKLSANDGPPVEDPTLYRSLAGALQYLTFTRPDIAYAVQQICLFMHAPREPHFSALKRIIRYIKGTLDYGLYLYPSSPSQLISYTDADWAGCLDTRRSTSGYCVFLGENLIFWSAKRQPTLSRSSAEAEYRGVANVVTETCWLRNLLLELQCPPRKATIVYCDNVSAVYLSANPVQHQRTKHIELDIYFVREKVAMGHVRVLHVPSSYQYADIFTKGLPRQLFLDFRSSLSVHPSHALTAGAC